MDPEKNTVTATSHLEGGAAEVGHLANQEDHQTTRWQAIKANPWAFAWCIYAVWLTILVSFENQTSSIVIGIPEFRQDFGSYYAGNYVISAGWQSAFGAAPLATTAIGAITAGQVADFLGRKKNIMLALCISFVAITLEFVATTNPMFFGGKLLNGLAVGNLAAIGVTYIGEITPLALRGLLTAMVALAYTLGPFTASLILNSTGTSNTRWAYRAIFVSQYGFAAVSACFAPFMPESPWWLTNKGKDEQALKSLRRLGYTNGEEEKRLAVIKLTLEQIRKETEGVTYMECFRRSNLRRTIISIAPLSIQALSGVVFIAGYSTYYAQLAGFSTQESFLLFVGLQVTSMGANVCSWFLIDKVGRRDLTLWGSILLTIILMVTGGLASTNNASCIKGVVGLVIVYGFFYNITIGATAYSLLCEVATSRLRIKTIAIGIAVQQTWYIIITIVLPYLFNPNYANLGAKIAFIFGGLSFLCIIYLWFYQVETANRSYEELDEMFMKKIPARSFKGYVTDAETIGQEVQRRGSVASMGQGERRA